MFHDPEDLPPGKIIHSDDAEANKISHGVYIPAEGVYFRLYNKHSDRFMFARNATPHTGNVRSNYPTCQDQFFTLVKQGRYWSLRNKATGKYLRLGSNDEVDHSADRAMETIVILFSPDDHKQDGFNLMFCLWWDGDNTSVEWLTCNTDDVRAQHCKKVKSGQQYWQMHFDDLEFEGIEWKNHEGIIAAREPIYLGGVLHDNDGPSKQEFTASFKETVTHTSQFNHTESLSLKVTAKGKIGLPFVADGEIQTEVAASGSMTWGKTDTVSKEYNFSDKVTVDPWCIQKSSLKLTMGKLSVPFVAIYNSPSTGQKARIDGVWHGATSWDVSIITRLIDRHKPRSEV